MKRTIVLSLGLFIIGVGATLWLVSGQEAAESRPQLESEVKQELKNNGRQQLARDFNTDDLYEIEKVNRETPFLTGQDEQAKFSYSRLQKEAKKSKGQSAEEEKTEQKGNRPPSEIKSADLNVYLRGIVKDDERKLIIVANQEKSYILEKGEVIKDYQVVEIDGDKVLLKKNDKLYRLQAQIKIY